MASKKQRPPFAPPVGSPTFLSMPEDMRVRIYGSKNPAPIRCNTCTERVDHAKVSLLLSEYFATLDERSSPIPNILLARFRREGQYMQAADFLPYENTEAIAKYLRESRLRRF